MPIKNIYIRDFAAQLCIAILLFKLLRCVSLYGVSLGCVVALHKRHD